MVSLDAVFLGKFEPESPEWFELRERVGVVSATLVPVVAGLSPWESPYTAWAKATGKIERRNEKTRAMRWGQLAEGVIKQLWLEENPGFSVEEVGTFQHKDLSWAIANNDGVFTSPDGELIVCEVKTSKFPFEDGVPIHYVAQCQWEMMVLGLKKTKLLLWCGDLFEYDIEADSYFQEVLVASAERWRENVLADKRPDWDGSDSTYETVKRISPKSQDDSWVDLGWLGVNLSNAQSDFDKAKDALMTAKSATIDAMGSACRGVVFEGGQEYVVCTRSVNKNGVVSLTVKKGKNV